jgi:hypothetical protein
VNTLHKRDDDDDDDDDDTLTRHHITISISAYIRMQISLLYVVPYHAGVTNQTTKQNIQFRTSECGRGYVSQISLLFVGHAFSLHFRDPLSPPDPALSKHLPLSVSDIF